MLGMNLAVVWPWSTCDCSSVLVEGRMSSVTYNAARLFAIGVTAAMLAACAQPAAFTDKGASVAVSRQASTEPTRRAFSSSRHAATRQQVASTARSETPDTSYGLASFYGHQPKTASGESFDGRELTAAHRPLPFGTRVRVTNVATGRSVTVRINDRGPYVPGRIVDVSHSAAESLGMVGHGIAKVKLDVIN